MTSLAHSLIERVIKQRDLLQSMTEETNSIAVRVTSKDKSVSAEVNGVGSLTGLWLGPPATRLDADALAKLIIETAQEAARLAAERYAFLLKEFTSRMDEFQKTPLTRWDGAVFQPE
jgi:DNA-binding protein YbaB